MEILTLYIILTTQKLKEIKQMKTLLKVIILIFVFTFYNYSQTNTKSNIDKGEKPMKRVTGIGGIFIKADNPDSLRSWYKKHLGIEIESWGGTAFNWRDENNPEGNGSTIFSIFDADSKYFEPSKSKFMVNFRVENLDELLKALKAEGCEVDQKVEDSEFGKFGWVMDPEGNRIELWQPPIGQ